MSKQYPGQKIWPLPQVTEAVLETVRQACLACENKQGDIFFTCLREYGATAAVVSSVIQKLLPDLSDTASLTVEQFLEAIDRHVGAAQAA